MELINIAHLKSHLSDLVAKVGKTGSSVVIGKYGKPIAKLVPYVDNKNKRILGFGKHLILTTVPKLQEQVDAPLDTETHEGFYS